MELVARLLENKGENFTILQPGDEAKLLGDDVDEAVNASFSLSDTDALETLDDTTEGLTSIPNAVNMETLSPKNRHPTGCKRSSDVPEENTTASICATTSSSKIPRTEATVKETPHPIQALPSDASRLSMRAARFGLSSPATGVSALSDDKLAARARRFGLPISETGGGLRIASGTNRSDIEAEKLRKRAERFGCVSSSTTTGKISDIERKASRLERFGPIKSSADDRTLKISMEPDVDKLLKRKERFGVV